MSDTDVPPQAEPSVPAEISNLVAASLRVHTGRGPTRAWTTIDGDLVSVVLSDTLGTGERSLVESGQGELVLALRRAFQTTMGPELIAGVERLTRRRVIAFLSANHLDPDIAIESFVLEPLRSE